MSDRRFVCCRTGQPEPMEACIQCALTGLPAKCIHPLPLLAHLRDAEPRRYVSVTSLNSCPRRNILTGQTYEKEVIDPKQDGWFKFRGTLIHQQMAGAVKHHRDVVAETRLFWDDWSGSPDIVLPRYAGGARLNDYKSTNANPLSITSPHKQHVEQVNLYALLWKHGRDADGVNYVERYGTVVTSASVWYLDTRDYHEVEVPLWTEQEQLTLLSSRITPYREWSTTGKLPPILPDETFWNKVKHKQVTKPNLECRRCPVFDLCRSRSSSPSEITSSPHSGTPPDTD